MEIYWSVNRLIACVVLGSFVVVNNAVSFKFMAIS